MIPTLLVLVLISVRVFRWAVMPLLMMLTVAERPSPVIALVIVCERLRVALMTTRLMLVLMSVPVWLSVLVLMFIVVFMMRWLLVLPAVSGHPLDPMKLPMAKSLLSWLLGLNRGNPLTPRRVRRCRVLLGRMFMGVAINGTGATILRVGSATLLLNCTL